MGSRSVAEPLAVRSSTSGVVSESGIQPLNDEEEGLLPTTATLPLTQIQDTPSTSSNPIRRNKRPRKKSISASISRKGKRKNNPEEFYMRSMMTKRQAKITTARALVTKAKVSYMKQLSTLGLGFEDIMKIVDKEFPHMPDLLEVSEDGSSDSSNDDSP